VIWLRGEFWINCLIVDCWNRRERKKDEWQFDCLSFSIINKEEQKRKSYIAVDSSETGIFCNGSECRLGGRLSQQEWTCCYPSRWRIRCKQLVFCKYSSFSYANLSCLNSTFFLFICLQPRSLERVSRQICHICGDDVGLTVDGELFVACNECAFPICRTCYEYERKEGNQVCPQCKTRFKRLKGCARVHGDDEEDGTDDLENEFNFDGRNSNRHDMQHHGGPESMLHYDPDLPHDLHHPLPRVPLLTNGQMVLSSASCSVLRFSKLCTEIMTLHDLQVDDIPPEQHALVPSYMAPVGGDGKRIHPLPFSDSSLPGNYSYSANCLGKLGDLGFSFFLSFLSCK